MTKIVDQKSYTEALFNAFPDAADSDKPAKLEAYKEAIKHALDIRKFEIELYWKRATYFWTFIGASFVAYFALISSNNYGSLKKHILLVSVIGFVFSYLWYFVNRGSKFWQDNWETHVDYLEDLSIGPLYKTVLNSQKLKFHHPFGKYPISVTKVNQLLSLIVSFIWLFMINRAIKHVEEDMSFWLNVILCFAFAVIITIAINIFCKSDPGSTKDKNEDVVFVRRPLKKG